MKGNGKGDKKYTYVFIHIVLLQKYLIIFHINNIISQIKIKYLEQYNKSKCFNISIIFHEELQLRLKTITTILFFVPMCLRT